MLTSFLWFANQLLERFVCVVDDGHSIDNYNILSIILDIINISVSHVYH